MWQIRATRERTELAVEPRLVPVPDGDLLLPLLSWLLTAGRRGGVKDEDKRGGVGDGEDKPTPAAPISGGGVGAASCQVVGEVLVPVMERINPHLHQWRGCSITRHRPRPYAGVDDSEWSFVGHIPSLLLLLRWDRRQSHTENGDKDGAGEGSWRDGGTYPKPLATEAVVGL